MLEALFLATTALAAMAITIVMLVPAGIRTSRRIVDEHFARSFREVTRSLGVVAAAAVSASVAVNSLALLAKAEEAEERRGAIDAARPTTTDLD